MSIEFSIPLNKSMTIKKKQKYLTLQDHQLAERLILVFGFYERKTKERK